MTSRGLVSVSIRALALGAAITLLAGCSTLSLGGKSAFGAAQGNVAEISNIGAYSADDALSAARAHFRNGDYGHSATLYKRVVELSPKSAEGLVGLGASYDKLRRFDLADRAYEALHKITGDTVQYYNNVGYSYLQRGNLSVALANFRKAQAIDPSNTVVANNIQMVTSATGKGA